MRALEEMGTLVRAMTHHKFGPKDSLGWPRMMCDVEDKTEQSVRATMSPLHAELKGLMLRMDALAAQFSRGTAS